MNRSFKSLLCSLSVIASVTVQSSSAADGSWNINTNGNWISSGSWFNSTIPGATSDDANTDTATFDFLLPGARTVTVDANRSIKFINFGNGNSSTFGYLLSGGNLLLNNGGSITSSGSTGAHTDTISSAIQLRGDGGTYTFGANSSLNTRLLTISGAITGVSTAGNTTTLTLNGANTGLNTVSGIIGDGAAGGKVAVVKDGDGVWRLSVANTATGSYTVNAGTLIISNATTFANAGTISLASGARLDVAGASSNLSKLSTGGGGSGVVAGSFLRYSADQTAAGASSGPGTILGTVELNAGNVRPNYIMDFGAGSKLVSLVTSNYSPSSTTLSGDVTFEAGGGNLTVSNAISASTSGQKTLTLTGASNGVYNGSMASGSGSLRVIKEGAGSWSIGNSSTGSVITGGVIINEGSLSVGRSTTSLGTTTTAADIPTVLLGDPTVSNIKPATLVLNSAVRGINFDPAITVRAGSSGLLKITRNGTNADYSTIRGGIVMNNNLTIDGGAGGGGIAVSTIPISGAGNLTTDSGVRISIASTYTGTTTVNSGTLASGVADALPDTALAVNTGATFDMSSGTATFNQRIAGLNDGGSGGGTVVGNSINTANSGNIQNRTLTVDGTSGTYAYGGTIIDKPIANTTANSTLSVVKSGGSSQTLSGANTYTGSTTISGGTFIVSGTIATTSGIAVNGGTFNYTNNAVGLDRGVTVGGGNFKYNSSQPYSGTLVFTSGTVSGSGDLSSTALTIGTGRTLSPGNSPGTLTTGAETWANGGTYLWEINALATSAVPGSEGTDPGWDLAVINGALTITAGAGQFNLNVDSLLALNNWNAAGTYQWRIATATGGVTGFNSNVFNIGTGAFSDQNPLLGGTFSVTNVGNNIFLNYAGVPEPTSTSLLGISLVAFCLLRRKRAARGSAGLIC